MMTSSNGYIFRVTGHLCGELIGHRWIPHTKASVTKLWFSFDLRLNKRLSKQSRYWWFERPSLSLWRHFNVTLRGEFCAYKHWSHVFNSHTFLSSTHRYGAIVYISTFKWRHCIVLKAERRIWHRCICPRGRVTHIYIRLLPARH